ncbi:MAG TPA: ATP-binding protein [Gemmatimonadaceae bacterium]
MRAGPIARLSLRQKLPLTVVALLLAVVTTLSVVSVVEVRAITRRLASERLASLTQQFGALFAASGPQQRIGMALVSSRPSIVEYARSRDARSAKKVLEDLSEVRTAADQVLATEIRDAQGRVLLTTAPTLHLDTMHVNDVLPRSEPGDSATIGTFRVFRDTIIYPVAGVVKGSDDVYVVRWRRVVMTPRTREQVDKLVGTFGSPYLGNPGGSTWVDFRTRVPAPPFDYAGGPVQSYVRDGQEFLAAKQALPGTPWMVALDVPMRNVMAPANAFLQRYTLIALLSLLLVLAAASVVTRRLTSPLVQLSDAATAISAGDFSRSIRIQRADELGDLGRAFSTMATEVQQTRDHLERKVSERTADLNATMAQLKDAQESLVRRERLALLGQLASGVGHELRNPLGVMTNSVYYLRMVLDAQPKNVHEYLDILQQQITLSEKIVSDLLDFARSKPPQRKPTSLADVCQSQVARLGTLDGVVIDSTVGPQLPAVLVDGVQAGQIVLNLLTNAVQAIDGPGKVEVRGAADGDRVHLYVSDTGPGVPPENLDKIFEPLYTTKARGIGLGLAVSRTLARANGGDLIASNNPKAGAVFRLSLLIASPEAA